MQKIIGKMARMYPLMIVMGVMIVAIAFIIGYINSQTAAAYFAESKLVRETTLMAQRASIQSVGLWLPYLKFFGLGLILGGIVMALRVILDSLKDASVIVLSNLPEGKRPDMPKLVVSLGLAGTARSVFANPLPTIDAAGAGSALLAQVQTIHSVSAWLVPFKFFGMATMFLSIVMGLATIVFTLNAQTELIQKGIRIARGVEVVDDHEHVENVASIATETAAA